MSELVFPNVVICLMNFIMFIVNLLYITDLPIWDFVPEFIKPFFGINCSFNTADNFLSFSGLLSCLLFLALYKEGRSVFKSNRRLTETVSHVEIYKKESLTNSSRKTTSIKVSLLSKFKKAWKFLTLTPFIVIELSRLLILIWILKYCTYWIVPLLFWIYYSIMYKDDNKLISVTKMLAVPIVALQFIICRIINIENIGKHVESNLLQRFGGFIFHSKSDTNIQFEYFFMLLMYFLLCLSVRMTRTIPEYENWKLDNDYQFLSDSSINTLEIVINFLLTHFDKIFIMALYMIGFSKLNLVHALFLAWMVITMVFPDFARKKFIYFLVIIIIRDFGYFILGLLLLSGITFTEEINYILTIQGLDFNINHDSIFFKLEIKWEMPVMIYFAYMQSVIYKYLNKHKGTSKVDLSYSTFITCVKEVHNLINKILIWVVYVIILLLLAFEDITAILFVYYVLILLITTVHIWENNNDSSYKGFTRTLKLWNIMNLYNGLALLTTYVVCFLLCTAKVLEDFYIEKKIIFEALGFKFQCPIAPTFLLSMQKRFLFPFLMFYFGFFVKSYIKEEEQKKGGRVSIYKSKFVGMGLIFVDILSLYSFHLLFFITLLLSLLWKLSAGMWLIMVIFSIHYCTLHYKYLKLKKRLPQSDYNEFKGTYKENNNIQKTLAVLQRKTTLRMLIIITSILILLSVVSRFYYYIEILIDVYMDGKDRINGLIVLNAVKAISIYIGVFYQDCNDGIPFIYEIQGYMVILGLCAIEIYMTDWLNNRIGFQFTYAGVKEEIEELLSEELEPNDNNLFLYSRWSSRVFTKENESLINEKYYQLVKVIFKYIIEHILIFTICTCVILKNNVLQCPFILLALICLFVITSTEMTLKLSYYIWLCFLLNYLLSVITMSNSTVPQAIDDLILINAFHFSESEWPLYKLFLQSLPDKETWAEYLMLYNTNYNNMLIDSLAIFVQIIYFQHFCNIAPSLKLFYLNIRILPFDSQEKPETPKLTISKRISIFIRAVFFIYSHIFCLSILLILGVCNDGVISFGYLILCTLSMQYDLFSSMGKKDWVLPRYIRCVVKPYVVADLVLQFLFQIPQFRPLRNTPISKFIGIEKLEDNMGMIFLKGVTFCIVLLQCGIFRSKQYSECCEHYQNELYDSSTLRRTCMALLYNNERVMRFAEEAQKENLHYETMRQAAISIEQWNQILLRNYSEQKDEQRANWRLEIMEMKMRITL